MADVDTAYVLEARRPLMNVDLIRLRDRPARIRCRGKLARAVLRVGGEVVEPPDAVERDADDRGAGGREFLAVLRKGVREIRDRKSTRLNSSHPSISYAVFCLE